MNIISSRRTRAIAQACAALLLLCILSGCTAPRVVFVVSSAAKKWVLSFRIGPPTVPPNWLYRSGAFRSAKKFRASMASFRKKWNSVPWN